MSTNPATDGPATGSRDARTDAPGRILPTTTNGVQFAGQQLDDQWTAEKHRARLVRGVAAQPTRTPWRLVAIYTAVAFALAWAVCLPFWFAGGLDQVDPGLFQGLLFALMYTPTIAALVVVFLIQRPKHPFTMLGLHVRPIGRTLLLCAIAWLVPPLLFAAALLLASALGLVSLDLTFESFRASFLANAGAMGMPPEAVASIEAMSAGALVALTLAQTATMSVLLSSLAAFGEELGWRGWLLPNLLPLGTWPAIALSNVIWGLWHAPIILLGYNFADRGPLGLALMVGFCVSVGTFVSWVRLRSASVYPAAIAHGSINAFAATLALVLIGDVGRMDPQTVLLGWSGWIPWLVLAALLVVIGQFARQPLPGLTLAESALALERRDAAATASANVLGAGSTGTGETPLTDPQHPGRRR